MEKLSSAAVVPQLLRNIIIAVVVFADESLLQISGNSKLLEKLRLYLVTCFLFFLRSIPSVVSFANPNPKRGFKFTAEKKLEIGDCASESGIGRAIWQLLSAMNEIPVNSRKYEVVRSLAERLIDENHRQNSFALLDLNRRVLNASFRRTVGRLETAVERNRRDTGEPIRSGLNRVVRAAVRVVGDGFTSWGGEETTDQSAEMAEKLAAELLWLAEKMSVYGFVDEAVEKWASASNLAWLALWSEPRLQCSMVQISDILGEVVAMNEIKEVSTADGKTKLLNLQLKDLGDSTLDIALWGNLGETVYTEVKNQKSGPVIFLGSLMKTSHYNRRGNAQSSKFATKVFINTSQPEIAKITDILCKGETDMSMAILPVDSSFSGGVAKNSFAISEMKTISELSGVNQDTTCNVLATIVSLGTGNSWFFTGCSTCFKTVTPYFNPITEKSEPDKYSCEKCPKAITTTQTRFKLKFQVMDHTGTTTFISFDDVVIPLIKKSAYLLLEEQAQFNRSGQTPPELLDLNGRQFVFKIRVARSEKFNSSTTYRVVSLTDGHDVIQSFSDCLKTLTGVEQEMSQSLAPSAETTTQKVEEPKAITLSGSSLEGAAQSSIMSSEVENLDGSAAEVNIPTPTSKRSLRLSTDEVYQRSSTKPKLTYTVKKEKK